MADLSRAAQRVFTIATSEHCNRHKPGEYAAAVLRAIAQNRDLHVGSLGTPFVEVDRLLSIAHELEAQ
jgi:hypothetical protein